MTPHNRGAFMLIKNNVTIGIEWRFGANWPGERCGAKTRNGTPCQSHSEIGNGSDNPGTTEDSGLFNLIPHDGSKEVPNVHSWKH